MAAIISLVTDYGHRDFYAGALKGALLKENPDARIVDTCHEITQFDIAEAAFVLKNAYPYFPENTLNIVCVNERVDAQTNYIVIKHDEQFFLGADNGLFSLAFNGEPELAYELERFRQHLSTMQMIAQTAKFILAKGDIKDLGKPVYEIRKAMTFEPSTQENRINGTIVYIDNFGNAVVNITKPMFDNVRRNRAFSVTFRQQRERIQEIKNDYHEVANGERLCIFNAQGYLEIAVNKGVAGSKHGLLGLMTGDAVQIDFT